MVHGPLNPQSPHPERYVDRFSYFCKKSWWGAAHINATWRVRPIDMCTRWWRCGLSIPLLYQTLQRQRTTSRWRTRRFARWRSRVWSISTLGPSSGSSRSRCIRAEGTRRCARTPTGRWLLMRTSAKTRRSGSSRTWKTSMTVCLRAHYGWRKLYAGLWLL